MLKSLNSKLPLVSVVIPTYNRRSQVERLLNSILKNTYKNLEIIVIDDSSRDGTYEMLVKKFKRKNIIIKRNKRNLYAAGSRNEGIKYSHGEYIFFVDDDNVLERRCIEKIVSVFLNNSLVGEVGPVNYSFNNKNKIIWSSSDRNMWTSKTFHFHDLKKFKKNVVIDTIDIPNAYMVKSSIFKKDKVKLIKYYGIMYEESDLAYTIRNLGYKVLVTRDAKIYHDIGERNFIIDERRAFVFPRNRILFHKKFSKNIFQFLSVSLFWSWIFGAYYIKSIFFSPQSKKYSLSNKIKISFLYILGILYGQYLTLIKNECAKKN